MKKNESAIGDFAMRNIDVLKIYKIGCYEAVTWILSTKVLGVSPRVMESLRQLKTDDGEPLVDNFRPVQDLNGRTITLYL